MKKNTLYNRPIQILNKKHFSPNINEPVIHPVLGRVYWAFAEMTGQLTLGPQKIAEINELRATLSSLSKGSK